MRRLSKNSRRVAAHFICITWIVLGHATAFADVEAAAERAPGRVALCVGYLGQLASEIRETRGLRIFTRPATEKDRKTITDYFRSSGTPHYRSVPATVVREAVKLPIRLLQLLDMTYNLAVNTPYGFVTSKFPRIGRQHTTLVTDLILYSAGFAALKKRLTKAEEAKLESAASDENNTEEIDHLIKYDYRFEAIRLAIENGMPMPEARKQVLQLQTLLEGFYDNLDSKLTRPDIHVDPSQQPLANLVGVYPTDFLNLDEQTRTFILDANHALLLEYQAIWSAEAVGKSGELISPLKKAATGYEEIFSALEHPDEQFSRQLIELYQRNQPGKRISLPTLKRFLMLDAKIRAAEKIQFAVSGQLSDEGKMLRQNVVSDLKTYLEP